MASEGIDLALAEPLARLLAGRRAVALAGAGMSTESGIPDYRGPETARRARNPIQARAFIHDPAARARYWARSMNGWPRIAAARPNPAHVALAALERAGRLAGTITQNVDGLHQAAGSERVIELHGALARVRCLGCGVIEPRASLQERLIAENPSFYQWGTALAPDGDADLEHDAFADFHVPACLGCGGTLKPDVVFFGENVPAPVTEAAWALFDEAEVLLVVGSSLTVYSGYRFVRRASERGVPVAIVNLGPTRGDAHAAVRVDARLGELLPRLASTLGA
ncbi:NAD-dependent protein deacetylase [Polyangium spumosum]|uniref:NAD-dependent protein deacetylase n=1 Tax=Polyangium spumosum TaxID=889282 RepID=UPI00308422C2